MALSLVPFQLWQGLRRKHPTRHRALCYVYVSAVVLSRTAALAMLPQFRGTGFAAAGFAGLGLLWVGVTLRGVVPAQAGRMEAHRWMMLRSVALSFAAVTMRLIMAPLLAGPWSRPIGPPPGGPGCPT